MRVSFIPMFSTRRFLRQIRIANCTRLKTFTSFRAHFMHSLIVTAWEMETHPKGGNTFSKIVQLI